MASVAPAPETALDATIPGGGPDELRGPALDQKLYYFKDPAKDAEASNLFGSLGILNCDWQAATLLGLMGLWWVCDFGSCAVSNGSAGGGMFGWSVCDRALFVIGSFLMGLLCPTMALQQMGYRRECKALYFLVIIGCFFRGLSGLIDLASNECVNECCCEPLWCEKSGSDTVWKQNVKGAFGTYSEAPCGVEVGFGPFMFGLLVAPTMFLACYVMPQYGGFFLCGSYCVFFVMNAILFMNMGAIGQAVIVMGLFGFWYFQYRNAIQSAAGLSGNDHRIYRMEVWQPLKEQQADQLAALSAEWGATMSKAPKPGKRQPSMGSGPIKIWKNVLKQDPLLSELFACADKVNPELQRKGEEWAKAAGACAADHKGHSSIFHPGKVKKVPRALTKVYRSYDEDCGRLCDLCRCSMVFEDVAGLIRGIQTVRDDPEVELQFCKKDKQRFDVKYDDRLSAGYRDVQLCVKVKTPANIANGPACENHLCEVQLHLLPFYLKKGEGGHKNYVRARNMRGA